MAKDRITINRLRGLARSMNTALHNPMNPYVTDENKRIVAGCEGHLHIGQNWGSWTLERMHSSTGTTVVLQAGTARELFDLMHAYWAGIRDLQTDKFQYLSVVDVSEEVKG